MREICSHFNSALFFFSILYVTSASPAVSAESQTLAATETKNTTLSLCPANVRAVVINQPLPKFSKETLANTEIGADITHTSRDGTTSLDGNVIIEKHLLRITADHADYNTQHEKAHVKGNVRIDSEALSLDANAGTFDIVPVGEQKNIRGEFNDIKFYIPQNNMKGKADSISSIDGTHEKKSTLNNASITSCDLLDPDWLISSEEIILDHVDEYGSAEDVVIRFKNIPFLYTPYIEFPISDKRRSGFLFPEMSTSTSRGVELATPWYWNIAPNHDAVIKPANMVKRGQELSGNYRYLTRSTKGEIAGAYLPDDKITRQDRYQVHYQQQTKILPNLLFDADLQDISDSDYFNDFSNNIGSTSLTHLSRDATLRYNLNNWQMRALVQNIKTIDSTTPVSDRPYERLPQLTINGDADLAGSPLLFTFDSEFVDFTHEDDTKTTGSRLTLRPGLSLTLSGAAWFIAPAIKFSHSQYNVGTETGPAQPVKDLNLPISSIDAGLFFERNLDNGYKHTLEPRLYYLYVPFEDQNNTAIFDTSIPEFSVAQLFRDNRFIGGDRIGDTNQLTLALTSRILDPNTGNEFIRASIGQIYYFEDRKVSLDGITDSEKQSDVIAELDIKWKRWQSNIDLQWDTTEKQLAKGTYFLHYKSDNKHLFNIGYRKHLKNNNLDIEQTDTSFVYAINRNYSSVLRWNYSLKDNKDIDSIAGIAYDSCCWSLQLLAQRRIQNSITDSNAYDHSILVQFAFKGFGSLSGSKARTTLEQSIYGYTDVLQ